MRACIATNRNNAASQCANNTMTCRTVNGVMTTMTVKLDNGARRRRKMTTNGSITSVMLSALMTACYRNVCLGMIA